MMVAILASPIGMEVGPENRQTPPPNPHACNIERAAGCGVAQPHPLAIALLSQANQAHASRLPWGALEGANLNGEQKVSSLAPTSKVSTPPSTPCPLHRVLSARIGTPSRTLGGAFLGLESSPGHPRHLYRDL